MQHAGQTLFAKVKIRLEPYRDGSRPVTIEVAPGAAEQFPDDTLNAVVQVLTEQAEGGGSLSFPLMQVKVTVLGAEAPEVESNEIAFRRAAADAYRKALREAGIVLLEPIMRLEITTPEEHLGDFVSDLQQRRALIQSTQTRGKTAVVVAEAPLSNLFGYSGAMRGLSQGRASCSMAPAAYGPAPREVLEAFL
jgi:elongation factor G